MKAKPYKLTDGSFIPCEANEATHIELNTPSPISTRLIPVNLYMESGPKWAWNGDVDKPTLTPSILSKTYIGDTNIVCHSFVKDGKIQFLDDCTHEYAGQTLDLLEVD